ncbi:hypothetical protein NDU88_006025 [Pleurodeles waltl]|uniref:Uncharacterized protein n=1 Tax=Pleurodeles waltl TaxID=8319 RepID=A0AAV7QHJ4_PLEWA|nr:hypothetical protein NDU88_006025 [Pleurodeles waltl]
MCHFSTPRAENETDCFSRHAPSVARKRRRVTTATRTVPRAPRAQETVRGAVERLAHQRGEKRNRDKKKNQPDKNKSPPAQDTKRALHSPPARDTKRALHSSTQTSRSASTQKLHYGRVLSTSAAAPPELHHSGSQIQHLQARNHRWADPDEEQTEDPSGRKSVGPGLVVTPRRQC